MKERKNNELQKSKTAKQRSKIERKKSQMKNSKEGKNQNTEVHKIKLNSPSYHILHYNGLKCSVNKITTLNAANA